LPEGAGGIVSRPAGLVDLLDRILDKGLVIAGDIKVSLVNIELLTLQIRLIICSIEKAEQIGLNWWHYDPYLTGRVEGADEQRTLPGSNGPGTVAGQLEEVLHQLQGRPQGQTGSAVPPGVTDQLRNILEQLQSAQDGHAAAIATGWGEPKERSR